MNFFIFCVYTNGQDSRIQYFNPFFCRYNSRFLRFSLLFVSLFSFAWSPIMLVEEKLANFFLLSTSYPELNLFLYLKVNVAFGNCVHILVVVSPLLQIQLYNRKSGSQKKKKMRVIVTNGERFGITFLPCTIVHRAGDSRCGPRE